MNNEIEQAVKILNQGGIIIFPTDTAFGIGCRLDKEDSVKKLFEIRKRPASQATPVLVDGFEMSKNYLQLVPEDVINNLINQYWPGALTIVLPCIEKKIPNLVRGGGNTIGVRMPNHNVPLDIIKALKVPILGPSANFHGEKTPFNFEDLNKELISKVDYVIKGNCTLKKPSTVIDCSKTPWEVLRIGAIDIKI